MTSIIFITSCIIYGTTWSILWVYIKTLDITDQFRLARGGNMDMPMPIVNAIRLLSIPFLAISGLILIVNFLTK